jgi:cathepsin C
MKSALFMILTPMVVADLPVHCLRHEVAGQWTFHMTPAASMRTKCGHQSPDASGAQPSITDSEYSEKKEMTLDAASMASSDGETGTWTMVYDEGFEVKLGSKTFFAFNSFDGSVEADGNIQNYKSDCKKTEVGWYSDEASGTYGCYFATKGSDASASFSTFGSSMIPDAWTARQSPEEQLDSILAKESFLQEVVSLEKHQSHVDKINSIQKGWTAKLYDHLVNKTNKELIQMSGIRRAGVKSMRNARKPSFLQMKTSEEEVSFDDLPSDFDWTNKDGKDFLGAPVNQGSCGSCYVISTVNMMSARKRINEDNPSAEGFSAQFPLFCGEYNQGCNGGYPELIAKWSHDVPLLPESCGRYDLGDQSCKVTCDVESAEKYKVGDYGYIGGHYGAATERNMMEEVHSNGPIAIAIEPQDDFMYYESGVYEHASAVFDEWTKVDHAVLLTGWGVDNGKKYWRVQNSWGSNWGEGGFFRIRRGVDESAVEAQPVFANVEKGGDASLVSLYAR